jgi:hypothetical protein
MFIRAVMQYSVHEYIMNMHVREKCKFNLCIGSQGSSVGIVSDYELDDWATGVRSPAEAKSFSSILCPDWL